MLATLLDGINKMTATTTIKTTFAGLALLLAATTASAIGLGEIKVTSRLNEPFAATIELSGNENISDNELIVQLAKQAEYDRLGITRDTILLQLKFTPKLKQTPRVIEVSSDKPIREPSLDFLIELQSPKAQLIKEYTVLLDPPK